ncbi:MAG TPA: hypothetical protein PLZ79_10715 [Burkholderiales bacterium]|nr:hypothetical protein [Burkholderiales bacterium]
MLYVDIPHRSEIERLIAQRGPACLSIYLPTTPVTQDTQADRIALRNLAKEGLDQFRAVDTPKRDLWPIEEEIDDLVDDDEFWRFQARSLALFATPERIVTFRLPNHLQPIVEASDRFHLKPLLRSVTWPQAAYVLALSQNGARVVEVSGDLPAVTVKVGGMPKDAASAVGKASILGRSPSGRLQGSEGQKVRLRQYARQVDHALRGLIHGRETPLILAANEPLDAIYRSVNSYPHLVSEGISGNLDTQSDADLAAAARGIIDGIHRSELAAVRALFDARSKEGRATTDVAQSARAATFGAVDTLLVDIDEVVPGTVGEDGSVTLKDGPCAESYGVVDEIAARAFMAGARVLGVRRADIPGAASLAAILRYPV